MIFQRTKHCYESEAKEGLGPGDIFMTVDLGMHIDGYTSQLGTADVGWYQSDHGRRILYL